MVSNKKALKPIILTVVITAIISSFLTIMIITGGIFSSPENFLKKLQHTIEFSEVTNIVESNFYKPVDTEKFLNSASLGAMYSLQDKYADFYTKKEYQELEKMMQGVYKGIGIMIVEGNDKTIKITLVHENSPADRAQIKANDIIFAVNNIPVTGKTTQQVSELIRENIEIPVNLTIMRGNEKFEKMLMSEEIVTKKVRYKMIDNNIYIKLDEFHGDAVEGFRNALTFAQEKNAKGIILDLRANPGGNLFDVVDIADMLLQEGPIISIKDRKGRVDTLFSKPGGNELPMSVIIDGNSASGSEALAGAIQDYERGVIVGETSFGKGIVQTTFPIAVSGAYVKLTTATYYTPLDRAIHEKGIVPDVILKQPINQPLPTSIDEVGVIEDAQLERATKELEKLISAKN